MFLVFSVLKGFTHEKIIFLFIQKIERNIIIEQYCKIFLFKMHRLVTGKLFIDFGSFHKKKRKKIGWQNFFGPGVNIMTSLGTIATKIKIYPNCKTIYIIRKSIENTLK